MEGYKNPVPSILGDTPIVPDPFFRELREKRFIPTKHLVPTKAYIKKVSYKRMKAK